MVRYVYDAWGNGKVLGANGSELTSVTHIGNLNPYRYRGYYYDAETEKYYLQTRYYDPVVGRFMTIDDLAYLAPERINGLNLYAYCGNNPVMHVDPEGNKPKWLEWVVNAVVLVAGVVLCFVPGGQIVGVPLLIAGGSMLLSNVMSAAGVNGKTASIITSVVDIVAGIALCFTPFASVGASMIGSGVGGLAGGFIGEALGGSFELGAGIGGIVGGLVGGFIHKGVTSLSKATSNMGVVFNPNGTNVQIGVDPNTLTISRELNPNKIRAVTKIVYKNGMYGVIEVFKDGKIIDGNHRVYVARLLGLLVDVIIH